MEKFNLCFEFLGVLFFLFLAAGVTALCIIVPLHWAWNAFIIGGTLPGVAAAVKNIKEEIDWRIGMND